MLEVINGSDGGADLVPGENSTSVTIGGQGGRGYRGYDTAV